MKLSDYMDTGELTRLVDAGYINQRWHPSLPICIYNYGPSAQFDQYWPHEICACRGLIADADENIISRPMYKFFNLNQPSTIIMPPTFTEPGGAQQNVMVDPDYLLFFKKVGYDMSITRKMDGMMGILWNYQDQWGIATRGSFESDGAKFATEKWQKFVKYGAAKDFVPAGWTLIFEIIAKHLRIVIPYEWEGLCLLTAVNNVTGEEMSYERLYKLWEDLNSYSKTLDANGVLQPGKPWCRIVEKFDIDLKTAENDQSMEEEGYVVSINRPSLTPVKAKIKLAEYKRIHRTLSYVTPQMIWAEMARPMDEWLYIESKTDRKTGETVHGLQLPPEFRAWIGQWQRGLMNAFHRNLQNAIEAQTDLQKRETGGFFPHGTTNYFKNDKLRKDWLMSPEGGKCSREITDAAMLLRSNRIPEAYELLWNLVRPHGKEDHFYVEGKGE